MTRRRRMRVAILTVGTRGDVQPYVAIGCALMERGHDVVISAPRDLAPWAQKAGLQAVPLPLSAQEVMQSEVGRRVLANGKLLAFMRMLEESVVGHEDEIARAYAAAADGADVVVVAPLAITHGMQLSRKMKVPLVRAFVVPITPTRDFAPSVLTTRDFGGALNKWLMSACLGLYGWRAKKEVAHFAAHIGVAVPAGNLLVRADDEETLALHAYSEALVPRPKDWPAHHVMTGMTSLSAAARARVGEAALPAGLAEFLDDGPPPVFFGFGSMPVLDPRATFAMIEGVAADLGVRALVGAGWSELAAASSSKRRDIHLVGAFDHDAVLPRCRAAVHHGGCGTTHTVLRAGLPAVVCSFLMDQPFWASRLIRAGVGAHLRYQDVTRATLGIALRSVLDVTTTTRARTLGERLRAEEGAAVCAREIERVATAAA